MGAKGTDEQGNAAPDERLRYSAEIQGNVLAPFNKPHQLYMFVSFRNNQAGARRWLTDLTDDNRVATTRAVADHNERYRALKRKHGPPAAQRPIWMGVGLTSWGLVTLHPELAADLAAYEAFWRGPLGEGRDERGNRTPPAALLGDLEKSDPERWVVGAPAQVPVDAVITLAADRKQELLDWADEEERRIEALGLAAAAPRQVGEVLRRQNGGSESIEHFGFRDGVSQPGIWGFTSAEPRNRRWESKYKPGTPIIATGEFVLGYPGERGSYLDGRRPDPAEWMRDGSFQLFLRLTQNVAGWWEEMDRLRVKYGVDIAAKVIGREQDGRPLAPGGGGEDLNDFTYEGDPEGEHTPRFAHIRRANPRNDEVYNDRSHRLLRRGIPFGPFAANQEQAQAHDEERGLLLNAFMASLEDQFEVVMRRWAGNSGELPVIPGRGGPEAKVSDGPDPLIGVNPHPCTLRLQGGGNDELALGRFVHTSGAVYAFAPSISTLRRLGRKEPMREGEPTAPARRGSAGAGP